MRLIVLAAVSILLSSCGGEEYKDLRDFVKNSGADMRGKIEPPPEVKPYEFFAYNNEANLPNPFKPRAQNLRSGPGAGANQPDLERPKEALEEFPLESLKMVGYLSKDKVGYAVIRATDNKLYRVRAGNYIGMNFGKITEVNETSVIIKELVQDSAGDWTERDSSLQLMQ
jgi:type IV pilus assembly protein PilP